MERLHDHDRSSRGRRLRKKSPMETMMRAARLHEWGKPLIVERIPIPTIGDRDVLVQVEVCGLNGGDPHFISRDVRYTRSPKDRTRIRRLPVTIGHEIGGTVTQVGREAQRYFREGERVRGNARITCGVCRSCRAGERCEDSGVIGFITSATTETGRWLAEEVYPDGGAAEYVKLPFTNLHPVPDAAPLDVAAKSGTLALGYRANMVGEVGPGKTVVVNGASGGSGVPTLIMARLLGARKIIAVARNRARLQQAKELVGPDLVEIVTTEEDIQERILELTGGVGTDVLIDYVPRDVSSTLQCIHTMRDRGRVVLVGGCTEELPLPYRFFMQKEILLTGAHGSVNDHTLAIDLIASGALDVSKLVTHRFPLEEINEAMGVLATGKDNAIWVVVEPQA